MKHWFVLLLLACPVLVLAEGTVYKSVDAQGRVTFSDKPPKDAVKVEPQDLPPVPSEEELEAARQRTHEELQQGRELTDRMAADRREREKAEREEEANRLARQALQQQSAGVPRELPAPAASEPVLVPVYRDHHSRYPDRCVPGRVSPDCPLVPSAPPAKPAVIPGSQEDLINRSRAPATLN